MKLSRDQKLMMGFPAIIAAVLAGAIMPISFAATRNNPLWLLLWIPCGVVIGVLIAGLDKVANE